ncbi:hypothetical protein ACF06W_29595 [Streptomyces albus]
MRPDSLSAAFGAVGAAIVTYGEDYPALLEEVWAMVREVRGRAEGSCSGG